MPPKQKQKQRQRQTVNVTVNVAKQPSIRRRRTKRIIAPKQIPEPHAYGGTVFRPVAPTYTTITLQPQVLQSAIPERRRDMAAEVRSPLFDPNEFVKTNPLVSGTTVEPNPLAEPVAAEPAAEPEAAEPEAEPVAAEPTGRIRRTKAEKEEAISMGFEDPNPLKRRKAEKAAIKRMKEQIAIQQSNIAQTITSPLGRQVSTVYKQQQKEAGKLL